MGTKICEKGKFYGGNKCMCMDNHCDNYITTSDIFMIVNFAHLTVMCSKVTNIHKFT